jgi:thioredoxin-like negative regulator of GroEL
MSWENFIEQFFYILYPKPVPGKSFANSFGKRALGDKAIPAWTRPLIFPPNDFTKALNQQVLLLQVAPEQSLAEAKFHLGRFVRFVERNPVQAEITFKEILDAAPGSDLVRVELASLYLEQHRYEQAVAETLKAMANVNPETRANLVASMAGALDKAGQTHLVEKLKQGAAKLPGSK